MNFVGSSYTNNLCVRKGTMWKCICWKFRDTWKHFVTWICKTLYLYVKLHHHHTYTFEYTAGNYIQPMYPSFDGNICAQSKYTNHLNAYDYMRNNFYNFYIFICKLFFFFKKKNLKKLILSHIYYWGTEVCIILWVYKKTHHNTFCGIISLLHYNFFLIYHMFIMYLFFMQTYKNLWYNFQYSTENTPN